MAGELCPLLSKKCIESRCKFWVHLLGADPQTGKPIDDWQCSFAWLPVLLVENANMIRQAAASSDKTASQVARLHSSIVGAMPEEAIQRLEARRPTQIPPAPRVATKD